MNRSFVATAVAVLLLAAGAHSQSSAVRRLQAGAHKVEFTLKASDLQLQTDSIRAISLFK